MKAVVLYGPNDFRTEDISLPQIRQDEILVKMERAAICGTDIRILEGKKTKDVRYPSVIGHEICGTIFKVGAKVKNFLPGEKVAIANVIPCGACPMCLSGMENACMNRMAIGYQFNGGFEEYIRIPHICIAAGNVVKLPESVSFTAGALIEPLACCIRGLRNVGTKFNDTVLVVGAGPIGLIHTQLSKISGARKVIVSEPNTARREKALELGADRAINPEAKDLTQIVKEETNGIGFDVVIVAIGVPSLVNSTLKLARKGGRICMFAGFAGTGESCVEINTIHYNELIVCGSSAYKREDYLAAADMVKTGRLDLDTIATHEFTLDEFAKAYEVVKSGAGLKVMIKPC